MATSTRAVPRTRVISPSPTPSEGTTPSTPQPNGADYFAPVTRSAARKARNVAPHLAIDEDQDELASSTPEFEMRARSRSRSVDATRRRRRLSGLTAGKPATARTGTKSSASAMNGSAATSSATNGSFMNGHLSPQNALYSAWREISRSPSPLGLIPIHRHWRTFIHKHEIPRKALHVSIGFLTLGLYSRGYQTDRIHPVLLSALIPIALVDFIRFNWPPFNRLYIRVMGAFMRETEAHEKYNGVIWYLLGAWAVLRFFPKDIGVMGVVLLSWCDTAASTIGRAYGRYTPRIRRGKSLAGSLAACAVGILSAIAFWGWVAPSAQSLGRADDTGINTFAFQGTLSLPRTITDIFGLTKSLTKPVSGGVALGIMSLWAGLVASASEAIDIFGWDDNVTIPVLCGVGLWGFLKIFGSG